MAGIFAPFGLPFVIVILIECVSCVSFVTNEYLDRGLQISTANGIVQGQTRRTYSGRPFWAYKGIPYARPPVGSLRFRAPKASESWQGILDATKDGSNCVEIFLRSNGVFTSGTEDCLFINVFTPLSPQSHKCHLPVLFFIYGGAFIEGNSSEVMFGPEFLLEEDIVVVTFNYRIGVLGFLSTEDSASAGNYGLKDQLLALQWVQKNIRNFGGDPNKVAIYGQSAGAASVLYHIASPRSKGLFQRAIAQSGSSLSAFARKNNAREVAFRIGTGLNINAKNSKQLVSTLRKVDIEELNRVSRTMIVLNSVFLIQQGFPFGPVIEHHHKNAFISENTYDLFSKGNFNRVPIIMGTTSSEATFFRTFIKLIQPLAVIYDLSPGSLPNQNMNIESYEGRRNAGNEIKSHYFKSGSMMVAPSEEVEDLVSDDQFLRPIRKTAQFLLRFVPVFLYVFSYRSLYGISGFDDQLHGLNKGAVHAEDLTYIWKEAIRPPPKDAYDKVMVSRMVKLWVNFARTGNPTPEKDSLLENITWPHLTSPSDLKYLNIDSTLSVRSNYRKNHMKFWDYLYDIYAREPFITY